jgi:hypothetical protein
MECQGRLKILQILLSSFLLFVRYSVLCVRYTFHASWLEEKWQVWFAEDSVKISYYKNRDNLKNSLSNGFNTVAHKTW